MVHWKESMFWQLAQSDDQNMQIMFSMYKIVGVDDAKQ